MPIRYPEILQLAPAPKTLTWTDSDTLLYALSLGMGADPLDSKALAFTYEREQLVIPSFAATLARAAIPREEIGFNYAMVVHGDQRAVFHRPMPPAGSVRATGRVTGAYDKGADKGALILVEVSLTDPSSGDKVATVTAGLFARGDGGFGGPSGGAPEAHRIPGRKPDATLEYPTRPDQALLYRLLGDRNPLHADPQAARAAGFPRPILHGLCTYGISCRAVLEGCAQGDPAGIRSLDARFSAPLYPGETLAVDLWRDGEIVSFEARAKERNVTVIRNGRAALG